MNFFVIYFWFWRSCSAWVFILSTNLKSMGNRSSKTKGKRMNDVDLITDQNQVCYGRQTQNEYNDFKSLTVFHSTNDASLNLAQLPDEILLKIYVHFQPDELCKHIGRVSRRFRRLIYSKCLWHSITFTINKSSVDQYRSFARLLTKVWFWNIYFSIITRDSFLLLGRSIYSF